MGQREQIKLLTYSRQERGRPGMRMVVGGRVTAADWEKFRRQK